MLATSTMTKRKPGIRPIGDNRTFSIASQRRAEPDLKLFAQALVETYLLSLEAGATKAHKGPAKELPR